MNKRMINNLMRYWSVAIITLLLVAGCSKEDGSEGGTGTESEGAVTLIFTASSGVTTSSRTELPGSDDAQHVTDVQLYIFDSTGGCVASEDVDWTDHFTATEGKLPTITAEMHYRVKYKCTPGTTYTFLAVGRDGASSTTYNFPGAITVGTSLNGLNATLGAGVDWKNMRESEFFTGKTELTPTQSGLTGKVDLYRRVAGVMGWFTNVPTAATTIQIVLYQNQNKSVPLLPLEQSPIFKDFVDDKITEGTGNVLVEISVTAGHSNTDRFSKGSYVLPVAAPPVVDSNDYTLKVLVMDAGNNILSTRRVKLKADDSLDSSTGSGTGIIDTEGAYRFPIIANHFYGIGTALAPVDLGGGDDIVIIVNPDWEGISENIPLE